MNGRVLKEKKSRRRNEENFEGSIGGLCSSWALSEWKNALTKLCLPVFTYATLQQANWISHSRLMLRYSRFLFLTIQVYWYSIRGKRIAKMWLIIAATQFFRHVIYVCGNYIVVLVQNISECYCCKELACGESLESAGAWSELRKQPSELPLLL